MNIGLLHENVVVLAQSTPFSKIILCYHFIFYSCIYTVLIIIRMVKTAMARKKFTIEYIIRSSPAILFEFVTQPSNLAQWFSDYCDSQGDIFIFGWNGSFQRARQVDVIENVSVKYHWEHGNKEEYFAFRVYTM